MAPTKDPRVLLKWAQRKAEEARNLLDQVRGEGYKNDGQWARKHRLIAAYTSDWLKWLGLVDRYKQQLSLNDLNGSI